MIVETTQNLLGFTLLGRVRQGHNSLYGVFGKLRSGSQSQVDKKQGANPQKLSQKGRVRRLFPGPDGPIQVRDRRLPKPLRAGLTGTFAAASTAFISSGGRRVAMVLARLLGCGSGLEVD